MPETPETIRTVTTCTVHLSDAEGPWCASLPVGPHALVGEGPTPAAALRTLADQLEPPAHDAQRDRGELAEALASARNLLSTLRDYLGFNDEDMRTDAQQRIDVEIAALDATLDAASPGDGAAGDLLAALREAGPWGLACWDCGHVYDPNVEGDCPACTKAPDRDP